MRCRVRGRGSGGETGIFDEIVMVQEMGELHPNRVPHVGDAQGKVAVGDFSRPMADGVVCEKLVQRADHEADDSLLHGGDDLLARLGVLRAWYLPS